MKPVFAYLLILLLGASAVAQSPPRAAARLAARAVIEGVVKKDPGAQPVKKALIELIAENQSEGGDYTAVTGPDGDFRIEDIAPGRYHLFAERTGFLEVDKHHARAEGRLLTLAAGQELKDLIIRLQAAAVMRGRVTDEDGDPLPNAEVSVLRESFLAGHGRWERVGSERTNDLGEYRIAGLPVGNFYVSVNPPPDFKSLIEAAGSAAAEPHRADAEKPAAMSYQTTYYPGTADRSQAALIQLHAGDDFPANFSLTPSPSLSIHGSVVNLPPRSSASILLRSHDSDLVLNGADTRKDGTFVFPNVAPGTYTILATVAASVPLMARQSLRLSSSVEGLRLAPQAGARVHGRLRLEGKVNAGRFDPTQLFLVLHLADGDDDALGMMQTAMGEGFAASSHVAADGGFEWVNVPAGNYYVQFASDGGANQDWFLKSVLAGNREVEASGFTVNGGAVVLDLVASANGAVADGVVIDQKGMPLPNAVVVAVPEARLRTRPDRYRKTISDQSGRFALRGLPPGDYMLLAWESLEGETYYNPEFLKSYEGQGNPLLVGEGDRKSLQLEVIPAPEDQP